MKKILIRVGQQPTETQLREIEEAARRPLVVDEDCPPSDAKALAAFAAKARDRRIARKRGRKPRPFAESRKVLRRSRLPDEER